MGDSYFWDEVTILVGNSSDHDPDVECTTQHWEYVHYVHPFKPLSYLVKSFSSPVNAPDADGCTKRDSSWGQWDIQQNVKLSPNLPAGE